MPIKYGNAADITYQLSLVLHSRSISGILPMQESNNRVGTARHYALMIVFIYGLPRARSLFAMLILSLIS